MPLPPTPAWHRWALDSVIEPLGVSEAPATEGPHALWPCRRNDDEQHQNQRAEATRCSLTYLEDTLRARFGTRLLRGIPHLKRMQAE